MVVNRRKTRMYTINKTNKFHSEILFEVVKFVKCLFIPAYF